MPTSTFQKLWDNYPKKDQISREKLFREILGPSWGAILDDDEREKHYRNTCAIRMSVAFNGAGYPVPSTLGEEDGGHKDKNGAHIVINVLTAEKLFKHYFKEYYWGISKNPGTPFPTSSMPASNVILFYRVKWADAFGHVDLWNGSKCASECDNEDIRKAFSVEIWKVDK